MKIFERSFGGNQFRPRPEIYCEVSGSLLITATPWGPRNSAKKVIQVIKDFHLSLQEDGEATSPFSMLTSLSPLANNLRNAVLLANDAIFNDVNKNEYISGVEVFVMAHNSTEIAWAQIGFPFVLLDRPQRSLLPLGSQLDLSLEFSSFQNILSPLPQKLLGIDLKLDFEMHSIRPSTHDQFLLLSRSGIPGQIYDLPPGDRTLEQISQMLSNDSPELPFWLGIVNLKNA